MKNDRINLTGLWGMMREDRGTFALALASLVVAACLLYLVPLIPQAVIDGVLGDEPERITAASRRLVGWMGGREHVREHLWIPLIWIAIYACFYASALLSWNASWSWGLMAGYLMLLLLVQSYTWLICRTPTAAGSPGQR